MDQERHRWGDAPRRYGPQTCLKCGLVREFRPTRGEMRHLQRVYVRGDVVMNETPPCEKP